MLFGLGHREGNPSNDPKENKLDNLRLISCPNNDS